MSSKLVVPKSSFADSTIDRSIALVLSESAFSIATEEDVYSFDALSLNTFTTCLLPIGTTEITITDADDILSLWLFDNGECTDLSISALPSLTTCILSGFTNVTNVQGLFQDCTSLLVIDMSGWATIPTTYEDMFDGCDALLFIWIKDCGLEVINWLLTALYEAGYMFGLSDDKNLLVIKSKIPCSFYGTENQDVNLTFTKHGNAPELSISYSSNRVIWTNETHNATFALNIKKDAEIFLTIKLTALATSTNDYWSINGDYKFGVKGNISSLINFSSTISSYGLYGLFLDATNLTAAPVSFEFSSVKAHGCECMFSGCTALTELPEFLNMSLGSYCFKLMFKGCSALTSMPELPFSSTSSGCFYQMFFNCTALTDVQPLNALSLTDECYCQMFYKCEALVTTPTIYAVSLGEKSCYEMFAYCTALETACSLYATTAAYQCYKGMFYLCTSLKQAPDIYLTMVAEECCMQMFYACKTLATATSLLTSTMEKNCYKEMFFNCSSLSTAPSLNGTTLAEACYYGMFQNCTSLSKAPDLTCIQLEDECYAYMFFGCSSLNYIFCLGHSPGLNSTNAWVSGVAETGIFYNAYAAEWTIGISGIPEGWTVLTSPTIDEYTPFFFKNENDEDVTFVLFNLTGKVMSIETSTDSYTWNSVLLAISGHKTMTVKANGMLFMQSEVTETAMFGGFLLFQSMSGDLYAYGNIASLLNYSTTLPYWFGGFNGCTHLMSAPSFFATSTAGLKQFFLGCTSLKQAPDLPMTTVTGLGYTEMFSGCTSLIYGPSELPALTPSSYSGMFYGCTSLITVPDINVYSIGSKLCYLMFYGCSSLHDMPTITYSYSLGTYAFQEMFKNCTNLVTISDSNIWKSAQEGLMQGMFEGCTSLTTSPILTADTLSSYQYNRMFYGCSSLSTITCTALTTLNTDCLTDWVDGVASEGTFYKNKYKIWSFNTSAIPIGWEVEDYTT